MDIIVNGHVIHGGLSWIFDTTSGNIAFLVSMSIALFGTWVAE